MNFRDLMKRYQEGTVTKEEKEQAQKELDKFAAIEEYYADELPDIFMEYDELGDESLNKESETKNINKIVHRRLGKVVLVAVLSVVLLYLGIFHGLSSIVDQFYFDPTKTTQLDKSDFTGADFNFDMDALVSLNMPGYVNSSLTIQESKGFGNYQTGYFLKDLFTQKDTMHLVDLKNGNAQNFYGGVFDRTPRFSIWEGFEDIESPLPDDASAEAKDARKESKQRINQQTEEYIEGLNDLSYLSMTIAFGEDLSMSELYQLTQEYPELDFKWAGIRTVEPGTRWSDSQPMHLIGFVPDENAEPSSSIEPDPDMYPLFNLNDLWISAAGALEDIFPEAYEQHFISRLSWLKDRKEFIEIFDYNEQKTEFYAESLDYIEENGVETYGVLVYATAEAFSESIKDFPYDKIVIDEISSSRPSINIYYD